MLAPLSEGQVLDQDEYIKADSTAEQLAKLKPAFKKADFEHSIPQGWWLHLNVFLRGWISHSRLAPRCERSDVIPEKN